MLRMVAFSAALAAVAATAQATPPAKPLDPNRRICEVEETTGTRLGARKVCMTAAQWAEKRREHRETVERAQKNVDMPRSN